jgi:aminomethyltransferase
MPIQYRGVVSEHLAVRQHAGIFDVSHLGKLVIEGSEALASLDSLFPGKVAALKEWQAGYNLALNESGGIVDDIFIYRRPEYVLIVPNAANVGAVRGLIEQHDSQLRIEDAAERWAILALQGPEARALADEFNPKLNELRLHRFGDFDAAGVTLQAARTGYTGEYGFELFVEAENAPEVWNMLTDAGATPAGLGARDTLRLEMGYPLHGNDIGPETDPVEASLEWVVDWNKSFATKPLLEEVRSRGPERKLVGLLAKGREIPRHGHAVERDGTRIGEVTSGNFSPILKTGIALAYVSPESSQAGTMLSVDVRGRRLEVEVVQPPFIKT